MKTLIKNDFILIVGSGYGVDNWVKCNKKYIKYFDYVIALNNAWKVLFDNNIKFLWYHSDDFYKHGTFIPDFYVKDITYSLSSGKFSYNIGGSVLFLDLVHKLANYYLFGHAVICCIGCDLNYNQKQTHFYGDGTHLLDVQTLLSRNQPDLVGKNADPLRYGKNGIVTTLRSLMWKTENIKWINLSSDNSSLLPFTKLNIYDLFPSRYKLKLRLKQWIDCFL